MLLNRQSASLLIRHRSTISAWRLQSYEGIESGLKLDKSLLIPKIRSPNEVLVRVHAASVNPLDVMMTRGYGKRLINTLKGRCDTIADGTVLGRDFSGIVEEVGGNILNEFRSGDEVWGATFPSLSGSHSEYIVVPTCMIAKKPKNIDHVSAASIPYAALTAWSALSFTAQTQYRSKVLVIGASGGVGSLAVQILKYWSCDVTAVCSDDAKDVVMSFGADRVLDYKDNDYFSLLKDCGKFDVILDCADAKNMAESYTFYLNNKPQSNYVTLSSPLLSSIDSHGLLAGIASSVTSLFKRNKSLGSYRWGYFLPNKDALVKLTTLTEEGKLRPFVNKTFDFIDTKSAYKKVEEGHARGKIVINFVK